MTGISRTLKNQCIRYSGFLLLGLFTLWWLQPTHPITPPLNKDTSAPSWFIDKVSVAIMDKQGQPGRQLTADHMTHFKADHRIDLTRPHFTVYSKKGAPWQLSAQSGRSFYGDTTDEIKQLDLWTDVHLMQPDSAGNDHLQMQTSQLSYYPEQQWVHSDKTVHLLEPGQSLTGLGMDVYLDKETIQLLSHVRGHHDTTAGFH